MKIAIILTEYLKEYVESYFNTVNVECELAFYTYHDFAHAGELYIELEDKYDGFLVSGPVPRAAIYQRVHNLSKPVVSFGSNALCYYETFFQIQYKEKDFYLEKGYFDLLEWFPDAGNLYQYLERGDFNRILYEVSKNMASYDLEQLCEMEERIKAKHIRLWNERKIAYSVTRFSNIMPDLMSNGVKTYFVYPKYEIIQEAFTQLLRDIHLKMMQYTQNAITALDEKLSVDKVFSSGDTASDLIELTAEGKEKNEILAEKMGVSCEYAARLLDSFEELDKKHITSQSLAASMDITTRSANRLLVKLLASGVVKEINRQQSFSRGRPEKIYCLCLS